jgi:hypothetical protein
MRIKASLSIFLLIILSVFTMITPSFVHAEEASDKSKEMLDIYCKRRDAANVSLEQWYGGKCTSGNTAELIGFGDIVILDLMEKLGGGSGQDIDLNAFFEGKLGQNKEGNNPLNNIVMYNPGREVGALQSISSLTGAMLANPPASSIDYIAYVGDNINRHNPVPSAYAATTQGFGFASLNMVLPLWKAFRNLTYLIFTLVFVLYGFMIMLRIKISAQAVTSIQLALPRIISTLLFITFSYAIAGLLIDLFYVIVGLILNSLANPAVSIITDKGTAEWVSGLNSGLWGPFSSMFLHIITYSLSGKVLAAIIPTTSIGVLDGAINIYENIVLGTLINIILLIALLIVSIKIFWTLVQSNVRLIMKVMFAPLLLVQNVFPNSKATGEWIKGIVAELSVFATVMIMFVLSFYFIGPLQPLGAPITVLQVGPLPTGQIFSPPPLFGPAVQDERGKLAIIGLGIFLMIPKLAEMVRGKFEKDSPFAFGKDLMAPLSWGAKTVAGGYNLHKEAQKKQIEASGSTTGSI